MKIGVVGNREKWSYPEVKRWLDELNVYKSDGLITGGAEGVDTYAQMYAKEIGANILIYYPDPKRPSPLRYFERNQKIAMMCDVLIAFNLKSKEVSGTMNTVTIAKGIGKFILLIEKDDKGVMTLKKINYED